MARIEAQPGIGIRKNQERRPFKKILRDKAFESRVGKSAARRLVPFIIEYGTKTFFEVSGSENIELLEEPLRSGLKPVLVAPHQSQGDVGAIVEVGNLFKESYPEFIQGYDLLVAKTMGDGNQGKPLQIIYNEGVNPWLRKQGVNSIEIISDNDVAQRQMTKTPLNSAAEALRVLKSPKRGVMMFPEATMHGGRRGENGNINGMTYIEASARKFLEHIIKKGTGFFIPIGIDGTYNFFDPDTRNFKMSGVWKISKSLYLQTYGKYKPTSEGTIVIGKPVTPDELLRHEDPSEELMRRIAGLQPEYARGIYK